MSDNETTLGETVDGERHFPEYTKGCWGQPGHKLCWLCKIRYPVRLGKLVWRRKP